MRKLALILAVLSLLTLFAGCVVGDPTSTTTVKSTTTSTTQATTTTTISTTTAAPPEEETTILVYYPNDNVDGFLTTEVSGMKLSVLDALKQVKVLPEDVMVNEIAWTDGGKHIKVDFNKAFGDLICTFGTSGEYVTVGSVVNTFLTANNAETMSFTIEGRILESGHVIYDMEMGMFE